MKHVLITALAGTLALSGAALAKTDHQPRGHAKAAPGHSAACPPGLAKKSPACVPPGQAKKMRPEVGTVISGPDYIVIRDPSRYGLDPIGTYYRHDGYVYRVDRETQEVLALIGAVSAILN
ncbi:excinuclease ABC subunit A [Pseudooceanicola onchidii]|uniref:excinuclease ABC subunit A n=1 Tax=Pseudooceanicola onchidii TaxID=2562279 RepID=UPI001F0FB402|nr:excinuclease ABC subunit A [Pseudooceanicola onchidii]